MIKYFCDACGGELTMEKVLPAATESSLKEIEANKMEMSTYFEDKHFGMCNACLLLSLTKGDTVAEVYSAKQIELESK